MRWRFSPLPSLEAWLEAMRTFGVGPEAAWAYLERGFKSPQDLDPPLCLLPLPGLEEASDRVLQAIRKGKRIRIHGDYDADGLTGTALLLKGLRALGAQVHAFIPHRLEEGYGVLWERLPEHIEAADLFITVDCGVTNHAELKELLENGVEVLVTDHHTPKADGPPPGVLVHPAYSDTPERPTGAGVAFLLLWKIHERLGLPPPLEYADLAAVGTVADVAPLTGWNRALVREGLRRLAASAHLGLSLLAQAVGYTGKAVEVAFRIAPRINAASRLGEAKTALDLLLSEEEKEARMLVQRLGALNARRQAIEEEMLSRLLPQAEAEPGRALVLRDPEGHPGVMGLVASRLLERFYKPVFIVAQGKGSVRSVPGISAVGALESVRRLLLRYGGHKEAAGFTLAASPEQEAEVFEAFKRGVEAYVSAQPLPRREVYLTGLLPSGPELKRLYEELSPLEPFGAGNPEPLFLLEGEVEEVRPMGNGHRALRVAGVRVVEWRSSGEPPRGRVQLAGILTRNDWQGTVGYEVQLVAYLTGLPEPPTVASPSGEHRAAWAVPLSVEEALGLARSGVGVYLPEEAQAWGVAQGFRLAPLEEAELWLGLPPRQVPVKEGTRIRVALGRKTRALLVASPSGEHRVAFQGEPQGALRLYLGRLLLYAYERRAEGLFAEVLARYLDLSVCPCP